MDRIFLILIVCAALCAPVFSAEDVLVWKWNFDDIQENAVIEIISGAAAEIGGHWSLVPGISGRAVKCDGYTSRIHFTPDYSPGLKDGFAVEAWVALGAYPWNWCPIISQADSEQNGWFFGVDAQGHIGLHMATENNWRKCKSDDILPLKKWVHVAGIYESGHGLKVFINGKESGAIVFSEPPAAAPGQDVRIGIPQEPVRPAHYVGDGAGTIPSWYALDGIIDEISVYNKALKPESLPGYALSNQSIPEPEFAVRRMPSGPDGPGTFGAYYAKLKYYKEWDDLWRISDHPDVVVRFDDSPVKVVFWRGLRYSPAWVSENGLWMADQSAESGTPEEGCIEHMQDIHCRYSHVRIIENSSARTVVHWRYAPVSSRDHLWIAEGKTGWAWWVDEYYTFYPDGTGVRKISWYPPEESRAFPWLQIQESSVLCHPGQQSDEVLNHDAITLLNLKGEQHTYSWPDDDSPDTRERRNMAVDPSIITNLEPENPSIQMINYKSQFKPFIIFEPGNDMLVYVGRVRGDVSRFPAYNHWPVCQVNSDGRFAQAPDRATSFSIAYSSPVIHTAEDGKKWANSIYGMINQAPETLLDLAKSWSRPPELNVKGEDVEYLGYDSGQRAYILERTDSGAASPLNMTLQAGQENPLVNLCFVIKNWGSSGADIELDGNALTEDKKIRVGRIRKLDSEDLVVWIPVETKKTFAFKIKPAYSQ